MHEVAEYLGDDARTVLAVCARAASAEGSAATTTADSRQPNSLPSAVHTLADALTVTQRPWPFERKG